MTSIGTKGYLYEMEYVGGGGTRDKHDKRETGVETLLRFEGSGRGRDKRSDNGRKRVVSQKE